MKLCKDCRWIQWVHRFPDGHTRAVDEGRCDHPETSMRAIDYVTGAEEVLHPSCHVARTIGTCKPEALLWEQMDSSPPNDDHIKV